MRQLPTRMKLKLSTIWGGVSNVQRVAGDLGA